jgi:hypothetical protein
MRHNQLEHLDERLAVLHRNAEMIQKVARGWLARRATAPLLRAARAQKAAVASRLVEFATNVSSAYAVPS